MVILQPRVMDKNITKESLIISSIKTQLDSLTKIFTNNQDTNIRLIDQQVNYILNCSR